MTLWYIDCLKIKELVGLNKVFLIGSTKDTYAPFESSWVQSTQRMISSGNSNVIEKIQNKILENFKNWEFTRIKVNTKVTNGSIDNYIGRIDHIQFIDNLQLIKMVLLKYDNLFI